MSRRSGQAGRINTCGAETFRSNASRRRSEVNRIFKPSGRSNFEAAERFPELIECLWSDDSLVRMRAADAAEKVSAKMPDLLKPFKVELLGLADETSEAELRWHLALMIPRLRLGRWERERASAKLRDFLNDRSSIVKTFALQGLVELTQDNPSARAEMVDLLEQFCCTGTPAMKARSGKLLKQLQKGK